MFCLRFVVNSCYIHITLLQKYLLVIRFFFQANSFKYKMRISYTVGAYLQYFHMETVGAKLFIEDSCFL